MEIFKRRFERVVSGYCVGVRYKLQRGCTTIPIKNDILPITSFYHLKTFRWIQSMFGYVFRQFYNFILLRLKHGEHSFLLVYSDVFKSVIFLIYEQLMQLHANFLHKYFLGSELGVA